jgi:hypothetical protein
MKIQKKQVAWLIVGALILVTAWIATLLPQNPHVSIKVSFFIVLFGLWFSFIKLGAIYKIQNKQANDIISTRFNMLLRLVIVGVTVAVFLYLNLVSSSVHVRTTTFCNQYDKVFRSVKTYTQELKPGDCVTARAVSTGWPLAGAFKSYYVDGEMIGRSTKIFNPQGFINSLFFVFIAMILVNVIAPKSKKL